MKQIALVGQQLIHTYPLIPSFNGCNLAKATEYSPAWTEKARLAERTEPLSDRVRVTRVWSPDRDEAARLSEALRIDTVCGSLEQALDGVDGVMVMDEVVESRTELVETCLRAGLPLFADKVFSLDPRKTAELIALAGERGVAARSWSQLYFHPDLAEVRQAPAGGVGFLNFQMGVDILAMYGIHIVSMLQGAFAAPVKAWRPLSDGDHGTGMAILEDGTQILLHVSAELPFRGRLYYCAGESEVIVNRGDDAACFQSAAKALIALFTAPDNIPGPDARTMREASSLLAYIVQGGRDGVEKPVS